ncbi:MAG: histidine--tRNA ligase [Xanthomonadales bacterium]|nr:histidine--tRNA ligase [Xanthomonadales bacterium]
MNAPIRSIRGMNDILPEDIHVWQLLESAAESVFAAHGFEQIRVPLLEKTGVFTRAIGSATDVVSKEMYSFDDRNGESLSLRPEGTAGVVRAALQNGLLYGPVRRLWYGGAMFRYERPQKGRSRQFHQLGAELFGAPGADADAEILALGEQLWSRLGLTGLRLELNTLGNSEERATYRDRLYEFLTAHRADLDEQTRERVERNPLRVLDSKDPAVQALLEDAPLLKDHLGEESRGHFDQLRRYLDRLGIEYHVNPRLVRGLDYYCHTVFEWITGDLGAQGTVCAGGRYDNLVELQGGNPWPGIGFAMGEERLVELLRQKTGIEPPPVHVYLVAVGENSTASALELAYDLRAGIPGLRLLVNLNGGSFKTQFKRADRSGASLALVLGEEEIQNGQVAVKFLRRKEQQLTLERDETGDWIRDNIVSI